MSTFYYFWSARIVFTHLVSMSITPYAEKNCLYDSLYFRIVRILSIHPGTLLSTSNAVRIHIYGNAFHNVVFQIYKNIIYPPSEYAVNIAYCKDADSHGNNRFACVFLFIFQICKNRIHSPSEYAISVTSGKDADIHGNTFYHGSASSSLLLAEGCGCQPRDNLTLDPRDSKSEETG